ncbi:MAG TPA: hypothetical protein VGY66_29245 [Gemmataceae bacterium]|jgi:putative restriction endonuclease|nr:hypothetical protein [Gemmataceae bacterium]
MATAEQWLGKLAHLKVDKARGDPAPHKPLLLLVVLELAERGPSFGDILALTPELAFRFCRTGAPAESRFRLPTYFRGTKLVEVALPFRRLNHVNRNR